MKLPDDPVQARLDALARDTLAAAPRPPTVTLVRLLAERRRAATASRRILAMAVGTSAVPPIVALTALVVHMAPAFGAVVPAVLLAVVFAPIIGGLAMPTANVEPRPARAAEEP